LVESLIANAEFKKIPEAEKPNAFKQLLKGVCIIKHPSTLSAHLISVAYQTEIDNLTKRSKASENAFLHVYKVLAEAPDPYPLLEAAVVRTTYAVNT
jgi:homeobox protein cut-like